MTFARAYGAMGKADDQLRAATTALKEAEQGNSRMMQANAQLELCWAYRNKDRVEEAYSACNAAQNLFSVFGDKVGAAVALNNVATWLSDRGRYPEAKQLYDGVIAINKAAGAEKDYAGASVNAAKTAILMGKLDDAQGYLQNALATAQQIGDKSDEALARIILGEVLSEQGKLVEAEQQARLALGVGKELNDETIQATALDNLAGYQGETNVPRALQTYGDGLKLRQKIGDQRGIATCLNNIGEMLFRGGDTTGAERHYQQSLKMFTDEVKDKNGAAHNWLSLAEVDLERNNLAAAEDKAMKALREFQSADDKDADSEEEAAALMVKIYVAGGRTADAEPYVKRIREIASKDRHTMFMGKLSLATYFASSGKRAEAIQELQSLSVEPGAMDFLSLEARLMLARLRATSGRDPALQKELLAIRAAASRAGFTLLAEKAKSA